MENSSSSKADHPPEDDIDLTTLRARRAYRARGRGRRWIDQRVHSISTRQELVHEWHERGIRDSEQYRRLTNELVEHTFGMDVNACLEAKGVKNHLRDHLGDLELALMALSETTAIALHRQRQSGGWEELSRDVADAGRIAGGAREQIDRAMARGSLLHSASPRDGAD